MANLVDGIVGDANWSQTACNEVEIAITSNGWVVESNITAFSQSIQHNVTRICVYNIKDCLSCILVPH